MIYNNVQQRTAANLRFLSYYSKWVPSYSALIQLLVQSDSFLLSKDALNAFHVIKNKLSQATLQPIDKDLPSTVKTDALNFAIAATLNQNNKPVAFHARTLSCTEQKHSSVEKVKLYKNGSICLLGSILIWSLTNAAFHLCLI